MKKMNLLTRLTLLGLVLVMLVSCFVACGSEDTTEATTTNGASAKETDEDGEKIEYMAEKDYAQYEFRVLVADLSKGEAVISEEDAFSDTIKQACYSRDAFIMERYNIVLTEINSGTNDKVSLYITNNASGDDLFDVALIYGPENASSIVTSDYVLDINDITSIDKTQPWYNQQANEEYTIMGHQYLLASDYPTGGGSFSFLIFNKDMMNDLQLELPYETILAGNWTIEAMETYCKAAYSDLDEVAGPSSGDRVGFISNLYGPAYFYYSMGGRLSEKDENGAVVPVVDGDEAEAIYSRLYSFLKSDFTLIDNTFAENARANALLTFDEGDSLFYYHLQSISYLKELDTDFGLAIEPKYDEDQESYRVPSVGGILCVSKNVADVERTGYLLEAMSQATYYQVTKAYSEEYRRTRCLRDPESQEVYDLCHESVIYDILKNCDPSNLLSSCSWIRSALEADQSTLATRAATYKTSIEKKFSKFYYGE